MTASVLFRRRNLVFALTFAVLLFVTGAAHAQGIGFAGGVTVDPEKAFVGTHFETGELFRGFRFRPGVDGAFGDDYSLATINIEFLYYFEMGRSGWAIYQGGGPAIVLLRRNAGPLSNADTSVHAGTFVTFGFAHEKGFFTDFRIGSGEHPTLKFGAGYTVRFNQRP